VLELLINYIALGFVSEFSTHFLEPFKISEITPLVGLVIPISEFRMRKALVSEKVI
jgi:hypothetical protein